ncbi:hypothetical protein PHYPO_G00019770 [Pangasianodon hypophthalmus]|uniref:Glycoprotein endo-alpha-1,2-mannosidase n=1 Tax=Pangasianodon hypophthalmus TaxID=310915 RepID=A0A5N5N768_PANHP|nr:hypothetical protein PHYPO_G00019770 [Pangasianodon hypophthalmus]
MTRFRRKICVALTALALFILVILKILSLDDRISGGGFGLEVFPQERQGDGAAEIHVIPETSVIKKMWKEKVASIFDRGAHEEDFPPPNYNVHVFYYTWYGTPQFDGKYIHWNHPLLPHWNPKVAPGYATGTHKPPDDVGASFYPALGAYSSRDPSIIEVHMQQLRTASIGVLAVSWYPPGMKDDNGEPTEDIVPLILEVAAKVQSEGGFSYRAIQRAQ